MPELKHIAVFLDGSDAGDALAARALRLAQAHGAHLVAVHGVEHDKVRPEDQHVRGRQAIADVLKAHRAADEAKLQAAGRRFDALIGASGVSAEFRPVWRDAFDDAELRFLHCDLIVAAHPKLNDLPPGWSAERLLLVNGGPVLLIPTAWPADIGRHAMIAWNASRPARRAVNGALPLLKAAGETTVLIVDADRYGDRLGKEPGADVVAHLARHGVTAEIRHAKSGADGVAAAIAREAEHIGADLTVIGCYSRSRTTEAIFGGVTRTMLSSTAIPLLLAD